VTAEPPARRPAAEHTVVHVCAHYPPYLGGLEKVAQALALFRRTAGLPVRVVTADDGPTAEAPADESDYVQRLPSWEILHTAVMPGLYRALRATPRPALLHLHVAQAYVPEVAWAACRRARIPYVVHLHIDVGPSGPAGVLLKVYKPLVLARILRDAAAVVVFTPEQRRTVAGRYGLDPAKVVVIPNGVGEEYFFDETRTMSTRPSLLFVGRLAVQKNLPLLLEALDGVSDRFDTVLVGDGDLAPTLRIAAGGRGLQNVRFHGRADGEELRRLYRGADVFVLPSEREGMPLVLLEALAMGLPVVATDIPGTRDVVRDGRNGRLAPPGDAVAFRQALLDVTGDPATYASMAAAARKLAGQYSWAAVGARFERLYETIMGV
jgi:glycosyltransferase involved in cell wall biosynthesis